MAQGNKNAPDAHDTYNMCAALGEEFGLIVEFTTRHYADFIQVVARARLATIGELGEVRYQSLAKFKYGYKTSRDQTEYLLAFDIWCQCDGMGATAAQRGPTYTWDGRVERVRRRSTE